MYCLLVRRLAFKNGEGKFNMRSYQWTNPLLYCSYVWPRVIETEIWRRPMRHVWRGKDFNFFKHGIKQGTRKDKNGTIDLHWPRQADWRWTIKSINRTLKKKNWEIICQYFIFTYFNEQCKKLVLTPHTHTHTQKKKPVHCIILSMCLSVYMNSFGIKFISFIVKSLVALTL